MALFVMQLWTSAVAQQSPIVLGLASIAGGETFPADGGNPEMTGSRQLALGNTNITRLFAGIFQFHDGGPAKQIRISGLSCMYALTLKQLTDRPVSELVLLLSVLNKE
jgi:hypothetical protein